MLWIWALLTYKIEYKTKTSTTTTIISEEKINANQPQKRATKVGLTSRNNRLTKENKVLQNVIHELIMNPESVKSKGIIEKVKQFEAAKNLKK